MENGILNKYLLVIIISMIGFLGYFFVNFNSSNQVTQAGFNISQAIPAPKLDDHYKWRAESKLTLINYYSMDCPFCLDLFAREDKLHDTYSKSFNLIYRYLPLPDVQPLSFEKAVMTECVFEQVGEEKMFSFIRDVFNEHDSFQGNNDWVNSIAYRYITDQDSFKGCLKEEGLNKVTAKVKDALAHGVYSTPTLAIFKGEELVVRLDRANAKTIERVMESIVQIK